MKILYIGSDHLVYDYDHLSLFTELGYDWFSTGHFMNPKANSAEHEGLERKPLNKEPNLDWISQFKKTTPNKKIHGPSLVSKEFVDNFDVVLVAHCCPWPLGVLANWEAIKHKPVLWRTYGQVQSNVERSMLPLISQGLKVVRGSLKEQNIRHALPITKMIRVFMNELEYYGWTGEEKHVLTFNNYFARREVISNTKEYFHVVKDVPTRLYGGTSDGHPAVLGQLSWEDQKQAYRAARVYFSLGSKPANLTYNFLEAMLTGTPTVTWGKMLGNWWGTEWQGSYEQNELIENGVNGFASDNLNELNSFIKELFNNDTLAKTISENSRKTVLKEFSKEKVKSEWRTFLESL